jgi:hypothetical protein
MFAYKGSFAANAATGNQTISGIVDENAASFTPKAVLIWSSYGTSAAFADGWTFQIGITDGTTSLSTCTAASDNVAAQRAESLRASSFVRVINSAGTTLRTGAFVSFGSGNFVINWTTAPATSEIFHYIAFGGTDLTPLVEDVVFDGTSSLSRAVASIASFAGIIGLTGFGAASVNATGTGIGWYAPKTDGTFSQGCASISIKDNSNPSVCGRYQRTSQYKSIFTAGSGTTIFAAAARDIFGDIFSAGGTSSNVFNPTLGFGGIAMAAGNGLQPTSTGTQAVTGLGFSPKCVLLVSVGGVASSATATEAKISVGACDRTRIGHAIAGSTTAVTPSVCVTNEDTSHIISCFTPNATAASSTVEAQASMSSIDADGFTLNWGTADATQREYVWVAFGDVAAATSGERSRTFVGIL